MLTIDGHNYDDYIVGNTYAINEKPEYSGTSYMDGWWKKHRTVVRRIVSGSVTLAMPPSVYNDFVSNLQADEGAEGDHTLILYVNNCNAEKTITAYVSVEGKVAIATKQFNNSKVFFNAVLTIEER